MHAPSFAVPATGQSANSIKTTSTRIIVDASGQSALSTTSLYVVVPPITIDFSPGSRGGLTFEASILVPPLFVDANGTQALPPPDPMPILELSAPAPHPHRIALLLTPELNLRLDVTDGAAAAVSVYAVDTGDPSPLSERGYWSSLAVTVSPADATTRSNVSFFVGGAAVNPNATRAVPVSRSSYTYSANYFGYSAASGLAAADYAAAGIKIWSRALLPCELQVSVTLECRGPVASLLVSYPIVAIPTTPELPNEVDGVNSTLLGTGASGTSDDLAGHFEARTDLGFSTCGPVSTFSLLHPNSLGMIDGVYAYIAGDVVEVTIVVTAADGREAYTLVPDSAAWRLRFNSTAGSILSSPATISGCGAFASQLQVTSPRLAFGSWLVTSATAGVYLTSGPTWIRTVVAPGTISVTTVDGSDPVFRMGPAGFIKVRGYDANGNNVPYAADTITGLEGGGVDLNFTCSVQPLSQIARLATEWNVPLFCQKPYTGPVSITAAIPLRNPFTFYIKFFPRYIKIETSVPTFDSYARRWSMVIGSTYQMTLSLIAANMPVYSDSSGIRLYVQGPLGPTLPAMMPVGGAYGLSSVFTVTVTPQSSGLGTIMGLGRQKVVGGSWRYQVFGFVARWQLYFAETSDGVAVVPPGTRLTLVAVARDTSGSAALAVVTNSDRVYGTSFMANGTYPLLPTVGTQWSLPCPVPPAGVAVGVGPITSSPPPLAPALIYITEKPTAAEAVPDDGLLFGSQTGLYAYYARAAVPVSVVPLTRGLPTYNLPASIALRGSGVFPSAGISALSPSPSVKGYSNMFVGSLTMPNRTGSGGLLSRPAFVRPFAFAVVEYPDEIVIAYPPGLLGENAYRANASVGITLTPKKWGLGTFVASSTLVLAASGALPQPLVPAIPLSLGGSWPLALPLPPVGGLASLLARPGAAPPFPFAVVEAPDGVELRMPAPARVDADGTLVYSFSSTPVLDCTMVPRVGARAVWAHRSDLQWSAAGAISNADLGPIAQPATHGASDAFAVRITLAGVTGYASITTVPPLTLPINVAVTDVPTSMRVDVTPPAFPGPVYWAGTLLSFTSAPYRGSERIYAINSSISVAPAGVRGSVSPVSPLFGDGLRFAIGLSNDTGPASLVTTPPIDPPFAFTVVDVPTGGRLSCRPDLFWAESPPLACTLAPAIGAGGPVWVMPEHVALSVSGSALAATLVPPAFPHAAPAFAVLVNASAEPAPTSGETELAYGTVYAYVWSWRPAAAPAASANGNLNGTVANCTVANCTAANNGTVPAPGAAANATVANCTAANCTAAVVNCTAANCTAAAAGNGTVANCTAPAGNGTVANCTAAAAGNGTVNGTASTVCPAAASAPPSPAAAPPLKAWLALPPLNVSIAFEPDGTSSLACAPPVFDSTTVTTCTFVARRASVRVRSSAPLRPGVDGALVLAAVDETRTGVGNDTLTFTARPARLGGRGRALVSVGRRDGSLAPVASFDLVAADVPDAVFVEMLNETAPGPVFDCNTTVYMRVTPLLGGDPCWALNTSIQFATALLRGAFGRLERAAAPSWLLRFDLSADTGPGRIDFAPAANATVLYWATGFADQINVTCPDGPHVESTWFQCAVRTYRNGSAVHVLPAAIRGLVGDSLDESAGAIAPWPHVAATFALPFRVSPQPAPTNGSSTLAFGTASAQVAGRGGPGALAPPVNVSVAYWPDSTSALACYPLEFDSTTLSQCTFLARRRSVPVRIASPLVVGTTGPLAIAAANGTDFGSPAMACSVQALFATGPGFVNVTHAANGAPVHVSSFPLIAAGFPDAVAIALPPPPFAGPLYEAGSTITITVTPLRGGVQIYALNSTVTGRLRDVRGAFGTLAAPAAAAWAWDLAFSLDTGPGAMLFDPPAAGPVTFVTSGLADAGNVTCPGAPLRANGTANCTVHVRRRGLPVVAHASTLAGTVRGSLASVGPPLAPFPHAAAAFAVAVRAAAEPVLGPASDRPAYGVVGAVFGGSILLNTSDIELTFEADGTSRIACAAGVTWFDISSRLNCTFTARRRGVPVRSVHPIAVGTDGAAGALPPLTAGAANWTHPFALYSALALGGSGRVWVDAVPLDANLPAVRLANLTVFATGVPDTTSQFACSTNLTWIGTPFTCELYPSLGGNNIYAVPGTLDIAWPFMPPRALYSIFGDRAMTSATFAVSVGSLAKEDTAAVACTGLCKLGLAAPGRGLIRGASVLVLAQPARHGSNLTCPTVELTSNQTVACLFVPIARGRAIVTDLLALRALATPGALGEARIEALPPRTLPTGGHDPRYSDAFLVTVRTSAAMSGALSLSVHPLSPSGAPLPSTATLPLYVSGCSLGSVEPQFGNVRGGIVVTLQGRGFPLPPEPVAASFCGAAAALSGRSTTSLFLHLPPLPSSFAEAGIRTCDVQLAFPNRPSLPAITLAGGYTYNVAPVALYEPVAGLQTGPLYLPASVPLNASRSYDPDTPGALDAVLRFAWTLLASPGGADVPLQGGNTREATAGPLYVSGFYSFGLAVTDNGGDTATATLNFTAEYLPSVEATIRIDTDFDAFKGRYDADDAFRDEVWAATAESFGVRLDQIAGIRLEQGSVLLSTSIVAKTVTDAASFAAIPASYTGRGLSRITGPGVANALISVTTTKRTANQPPVAAIAVRCKSRALSAGRYEIAASACTLDGTRSSDPDGFVGGYSWSLLPGPENNCPVYPGSPGWRDGGTRGTLLLLVPGMEGTCVVGLSVQDNDRMRSRRPANVTLLLTARGENEPPAIDVQDVLVEIDPEDGSYANRTAADLTAVAADPDGLLTASAWAFVGGDGPLTWASVSNVSAGDAPVQRLSVTARATVYGLGAWSFRVSATDDSGATTARNATLTVRMGPQPPSSDSVSPDAARKAGSALAVLALLLALYNAAARVARWYLLEWRRPPAVEPKDLRDFLVPLPQVAAGGTLFAISHIQSLASVGLLTNQVMPASFQAFCEPLYPFLLLTRGPPEDPLPRNVRAEPVAAPPPAGVRRLLYSRERDVASGFKSVLLWWGVGFLLILAGRFLFGLFTRWRRRQGSPPAPTRMPSGPLVPPALELEWLFLGFKPMAISALGLSFAEGAGSWRSGALFLFALYAAVAIGAAQLALSYFVRHRGFVVYEEPPRRRAPRAEGKPSEEAIAAPKEADPGGTEKAAARGGSWAAAARKARVPVRNVAQRPPKAEGAAPGREPRLRKGRWLVVGAHGLAAFRFAHGFAPVFGPFQKSNAGFRTFELLKGLAWAAALGAFARTGGANRDLDPDRAYNVAFNTAFAQLFFCFVVEWVDLIAQIIFRPRLSAWAVGACLLSPLLNVALLTVVASALLKYKWPADVGRAMLVVAVFSLLLALADLALQAAARSRWLWRMCLVRPPPEPPAPPPLSAKRGPPLPPSSSASSSGPPFAPRLPLWVGGLGDAAPPSAAAPTALSLLSTFLQSRTDPHPIHRRGSTTAPPSPEPPPPVRWVRSMSTGQLATEGPSLRPRSPSVLQDRYPPLQAADVQVHVQM